MRRIFFVLGVLVFVTASTAQTSQALLHVNVDEKKLALEGYDPVSYLKEMKAVKGKASISTVSGGVKYYFSTEQHKNLFLASPTSYQPQYGGWCAYAMGAKGEKVEVDPETFKIVDGKLYLFYNRFFNNTLESWNKNEPVLKANADKNWIKITSH